jgi:hypothetical protein
MVIYDFIKKLNLVKLARGTPLAILITHIYNNVKVFILQTSGPERLWTDVS